MIAKVPTKRDDGNSSFATLGKYITGEKLDRETGEILRDESDIYVDTNCLSVNTASAEMRAASDMNGRVRDPVYHAMISWRSGEEPSNEQMIAAAKAAQAAVGMDGHQYLYAVHRDTDNIHVHMMINRVHPDTYKSVYPDRDFFKLDKCMREIELQQGWQHDRGPYEVQDGKVVKAERDQTQAARPSTAARDMEAATGSESLLTYSQRVSGSVVAALEKRSWHELHAALHAQGLEIREAGQGFKIHDLHNSKTTPIKASDMAGELGGGKLKKLLGAYEKPLRIIQSKTPEQKQTYNPYREKMQAGRDERSEARAAARLALRQRYDAERAAHKVSTAAVREVRDAEEKAAREAINEKAKRAREAIRGNKSYTRERRQAELSIVAMKTILEREQLRAARMAKYETERMPGYKDWCTSHAENGDAAAIAELKGWAYQDSRRRSAAERAEREAAESGAMLANVPKPDAPAAPKTLADSDMSITWLVDRRSGDVTYQISGIDALRDTGRLVAVLQPESASSIEAGLKLAAQKFGSKLTLTGPPEFQRRVVEVAVKNGMGVTFADKEMEAYRVQLEKARLVEVAVKKGVAVTFADPQMEAARVQLEKTKDAKRRPASDPETEAARVKIERNRLVEVAAKKGVGVTFADKEMESARVKLVKRSSGRGGR